MIAATKNCFAETLANKDLDFLGFSIFYLLFKLS
jgi:hypothetical protein